MSLFLNPIEYGMKHDGRLVIYNVKDEKYFDWRPVKQDKLVDISDAEIVNNLVDFKFKFQERIDDKWVDLKNYFYLEKSRFIRQFWTEKITMNNEEIKNVLTYFSKNDIEKDYEIIKDAVSRTVNYIMKIRQPKFNNLKKYFEILDKSNIELPLIWENINIYLKELVDLKEQFHNRKLIGKSYLELKKTATNETSLSKYLNDKVDYLSSLNKQFPDVLTGILYSFLGNREKASIYINQALGYNNNYINDFNLGLGLTTYIDNPGHTEFDNVIKYNYQEKFEEREVTFTVSVDESFLRKYGMQMFYSIIALKKYHFHFHVIANSNEAEKVITESQNLFNHMSQFFKTKEKIVSPTFSSEEVPVVFANKTTYYACARFVNAKKLIEKFNSDIVTIDADFVITDDLQKMINEISKNDVAITITTGFTSLLPWTRFMGGTLYLKNNNNAKAFIHETRSYILSNMSKKNTWTLDQNALCYAYESIVNKISNVKVGDITGYPRPLTQPRIRRFIED